MVSGLGQVQSGLKAVQFDPVHLKYVGQLFHPALELISLLEHWHAVRHVQPLDPADG